MSKDEFMQEKGGLSLEVKLLDNNLVYKMSKDGTQIDTIIPYDKIKVGRVRFNKSNLRFKIFGSLFVSIFFILWFFSNSISYLSLFILLIGVLCFIQLNLDKVKYVTLKTETFDIYAIDDPEGNEILDRILAKRNLILKEKFGKLFRENGVDNELKRLANLREEGVLTDDEFENLVKGLR